jgi:3-oxoadipate enol-lactonase
MKTVTSGDAQLRCEHTLRPGAPALLLINSLGASLEMWDDQFAALSERYELIRYDARGHGRSSAGSITELPLSQLADDALAILDACGIARAHVCGLSMGGMTAMHMARYTPDRVLKLILCNTTAHMPPKDTWQSRIDTVLSQGIAPLVEGTLERWFTPEFREQSPQQVGRIRKMLLSTDPRGYAACCAALRDMDLREELKSITAKTMIIAGQRDPATPLVQSEFMHTQIAESKLVALDTAHLSNIGCAPQFTAALLDFLVTA